MYAEMLFPTYSENDSRVAIGFPQKNSKNNTLEISIKKNMKF